MRELVLKKLREVDAEAFRAACIALVERGELLLASVREETDRKSIPLGVLHSAILAAGHAAIIRALLFVLVAAETGLPDALEREAQPVAAVRGAN